LIEAPTDFGAHAACSLTSH